MSKKKALVLGATGQDGSYMIDLLLRKNYEVHGLYRKSSVGNTSSIDYLINDNKIFNKRFFLHKGDLLDTKFLGKRQLAYPINNMNYANYVHLDVTVEPETLNLLEEKFRYDQNGFRHLTVKLT